MEFRLSPEHPSPGVRLARLIAFELGIADHFERTNRRFDHYDTEIAPELMREAKLPTVSRLLEQQPLGEERRQRFRRLNAPGFDTQSAATATERPNPDTRFDLSTKRDTPDDDILTSTLGTGHACPVIVLVHEEPSCTSQVPRVHQE